MAKKFTTIPQNTFQALQLDAGVLLRTFDPENPVAPDDSAIICATTGGIQVNCTPTYSDLGEDVDNCPENMKELKNLDSWACTMSFTSLGTSPDLLKLALGAADIDGTTKIIPRKDLEQTDFANLWWVGDRADGGCVAVKLINALSTGGLQLQTTKNGKGQISVELTGHVSLADQTTMPMEFYSIDPEETTSFSVTQTLENVTSSFTGESVTAESAFTATLTADTGYTLDTVSVKMGGVDITSTAYTAGTGAISIGSVTGAIIINATATEN